MARRKSYKPTEFSHREKEANINDYRLDMGLTLRELGEIVGLTPSQITDLNAGIQSPLFERGKRAGKIKPQVLGMCKLFDCTPGELFPRYFCEIQRATPSKQELAKAAESTYLHKATKDPLEILIEKDTINNILQRLPNNLRVVYIMYNAFGCTYDDIGKVYGYSRQYAEFLVSKARRLVNKIVHAR